MSARTFPRETSDALTCIRAHLALSDESPSGLIWSSTGRPAGSVTTCRHWRVYVTPLPYNRDRRERRHFAHRLVWALHHGSWPTMGLDHINGDGLDNRPANLREATSSTNARNLVRLTCANRSGFPGVSQHIKGGWQASVQMGRATHYAGHFSTKEAAFVAAYAAKQRLHPDAIGFFAAWRPAYEACCVRVATARIFGEPRASIFGPWP